MTGLVSLWQKYRLRLKRRRLLWRSFRARHHLTAIAVNDIPHDGVLLFSVIRNEFNRLPYFLDFYRKLGVSQFLFIDNVSDDGSLELLQQQDDCSVWSTSASYRDARFGLDWLTWLMIKYGHNRWCLMADADELLVFDGDDQHTLTDLTKSLDRLGQIGFGTLMLDLYPDGALGDQTYESGGDPRDVLTHFDVGPYRQVRQLPKQNLWLQGGVRERVFFQSTPDQSPTLNKIPLIKWNRRFAWVNACHSLLPARLNFQYDGPEGKIPSGALLHTKFLPEIVSKSETERARQQHFHTPEDFEGYYADILASPNLMCDASVKYKNPRQLADLGLISKRDWFLSD